ncbi:hypothetical protein ACPC54_23570 [Kitasatospora sp. NPDC094028]
MAHLHGRASGSRSIGRFAPQGQPAVQLSKPAARPSLTYPNGRPVTPEEWPGLYKVFCRLYEDQGHATKGDLVEHGQFGSRDTVRRALDVWMQHGVLSEKAGKVERFFLPTEEEG